MRIAICLSGQPRTWRKCLDWWSTMFSSQTNVTIDLFFHLWDYNTLPCGLLLPTKNVKISEQEKVDLLDAYKPTDYIFESEFDTKEFLLDSGWQQALTSEGKVAALWTTSQFYGISRVAHLKRQYEIENGFEYDICVRGRTDLKFFPSPHHDGAVETYMSNLPLPGRGEVRTIHTGFDRDMYASRVGDAFYYSDSLTFDRIGNFFRMMPVIKEEFFVACPPPEFGLYFFLCMNGIEISPLDLPVVKIMRSDEYTDILNARGTTLGDHETI